MLFAKFFFPRRNLRPVLRDLHTFGIISVFRRDSIFNVWAPLREPAAEHDDFPG